MTTQGETSEVQKEQEEHEMIPHEELNVKLQSTMDNLYNLMGKYPESLKTEDPGVDFASVEIGILESIVSSLDVKIREDTTGSTSESTKILQQYTNFRKLILIYKNFEKYFRNIPYAINTLQYQKAKNVLHYLENIINSFKQK